MSRRELIKALALAPFLLRASPFFGASPLLESPPNQSVSPLAFAELRLHPQYPLPSPLEPVLRLVAPGSDEYVEEKHSVEISTVLRKWERLLQAGDLLGIRQYLHPSFQASSLRPTRETLLRSGAPLESLRRDFSESLTSGSDQFLTEISAWTGVHAQLQGADFEITAIKTITSTPLTVQLKTRYTLVASQEDGQRSQQVGSCQTEWVRDASTDISSAWKLRRWQAGTETLARVKGPGFVDVTRQALGAAASYTSQLVRGSDHWRTVLDGACGIDVYGNNGVAAGDFDNDGFDDLYICQPAGLPNRLYRNHGDGTFEDVTEAAGVAVLDNTSCALFADLRNIGLQDLLVVCSNGPLLFLNQGNGTFKRKADAFQFARSPQGSFTHAALADYDRDGRLDIYFCLYSYYLGLDQYHYPVPYFDARNGPPNFLFHNEGNGTFADRTEAAGLNADNDRYSFACAWGESSASGLPDLYVVNDFGRNNFYRNRGDGTFSSDAKKAHVEDVGAGMSACWADFNNDGRPDLYVANMWSAAGQRVSGQARFHAEAPDAIRQLYQRHAQGNALYRNQGNDTFLGYGEQAGADMGRWAWGSDAWDFDHDGFTDLYIANGYISAAGPGVGASGHRPDAEPVPADLASFFWRQVVAKSPNDSTPSLAYEHGWNALNELIRSDNSWSGHERNVMLANNRDGTFSEVSAALGLDFLEDGRAFALADLDGDGRLEVILKNRSAPQLRILHNAMAELGDSVAFRLQGTRSNRDAVGAAITLEAGELRQTKYLQAGSGFLAQHSKEVFFGVGKGSDSLQATVRWPSGLVQTFKAVPRNHRISLQEGTTTFNAKAFSARGQTPAAAEPPAPADAGASRGASDNETWLIQPLPAPEFSLPDLAGIGHALASMRGHCVLLHLWSVRSTACEDQLRLLERHQGALKATGLQVAAVNMDREKDRSDARALAERGRLSFPLLFATEEIAGIYNLVYRYLFDRRRDLPLPTSFLLDPQGMIVKLYQGPVTPADLLRDVPAMPSTPAERVHKALPFTGISYQNDFQRNDFTYGVAMFQHGYLEQAAASFQQVIAAKPDSAEGYYNLGTLNLRRNDLTQARSYFEHTLKLRPNYPEAWNNLGMVAAQQGHPDEAIQSFQQALQLRPDYAITLLNLGNVYRRRGDSRAKDTLTRALVLQPDDPEANYSLGMLYAQQDQMKPAADLLRTAIALRPTYPEALNNLGVLFVQAGDYAAAEQQFRTCVQLVPSFDQSYLNLARLYMTQGKKAGARQAIEDLLRLQPENAAAKQALQILATTP